MKDAFAREITYLRLSVTDRCNLRCRYCMPPAGTAGGLCSAGELLEIVRQAAACGIRKVRLTGGEPLVRRDILDVCRGAAATAGVEELCLTTNGTRLPAMARPLREAGVDRLNVSLDTLRPDRFARLTGQDCLGDVLRGLEAAAEAGFTGTKLNVVLLAGFNEDEIRDFVELARRYPLEVRFIELMPIGEGVHGTFLPAQAVLDACPELLPAGDGGVARRFRLPEGRGMVGLIAPMSHRFCTGCDRIRVTADGKLKPCLHSGKEFPLRGLAGEGLRRELLRGIAAKPASHRLTETGRSGTGRTMNQIGG